MALHTAKTTQAVLFGAAGLLVVLGLLTDGPLGVAPVVRRRMHAVLDVVLVGALAAVPLLVGAGRSLASILVAEGSAVALGQVSWSTRYRKVEREKRAGAGVERAVAGGARRLGVVAGVLARRLGRDR